VDVRELLALCDFPKTDHVDLAVSGGPDSMGLLLLALEEKMTVRVHHVDHHARATSGEDATFVEAFCAARQVAFIRHDVHVMPGPNFEQRARNARRNVLPETALTGHTMDDLAETILLNLFRGAGYDGLTPMAPRSTKPLLRVRRSDLHAYVASQGVVARMDESNDDQRFRRNQIRHDVLPLVNAVMDRDVVSIIARQSALMFDERAWLDALSEPDQHGSLEARDCRELREWPRARLRRWLRWVLRTTADGGDSYPPSADEVERAIAVVTGEVVACELSGGRRLSRKDQRLTLAP
jgi:tRNA(Ile)-lysidine synthase